MFSRFFIDRPIFASVLSIVITLAGGISVFQLALAQFPQVAPTTVVVTCNYPGASAADVAGSVATPIEQQVNGIEGMYYMSSTSTNDGGYTLTVTFQQDVDINMAQVLVQTRVALAIPILPEVIKQTGVTVKKQTPDILMGIAITSKTDRYDQLYLSNFALMQVRDELSRVDGVSDIKLFGQRDYSMRIWVDPTKLAMRNLTAGDVVSAVREQNRPVAAGVLGAPPVSGGQEFQFTMATLGRLSDSEQFDDIILKTASDGTVVRVKDIGHAELAAKNEDLSVYFDAQPTIFLAIWQLPDANALATHDRVVGLMNDLSRSFPEGIEWQVAFDTTPYTRESIKEVFKTLGDAVVLVSIVVLVFLRNWRSALIPMIAVPVAIVGTFTAMFLLHFSLNTLTLFGLVLAIGIVVDDAIVVVEAVEHHIDLGLSPRDATIKAMEQVSGPVIAVGLVLSAVFVPCAFVSGLTGQFFRQFAVAIAVSTVISAFNSLTLSPALAALLLRPRDKHSAPPLPAVAYALAGGLGAWLLIERRAPQWADWHSIYLYLGIVAGIAVGAIASWPVNWFLARAFAIFNRMFDWLGIGYVFLTRQLLRGSALVLVGYGALLWLTYKEIDITPKGFVPTQDMGYLLVGVSLPDAASMERTQATLRRMSKMARETPGVRHATEVAGQSFITGGFGPNFGTMFINLKDYDERLDPALHSEKIKDQIQTRFNNEIRDAQTMVVGPPPVRGAGRGGGFMMYVEDRGDLGIKKLQAEVEDLVANSNKDPALMVFPSTFRSNVPQLKVEPDMQECLAKGISMRDFSDTLQVYQGSLYVNDFNLFGRAWQVIVQAEPNYRDQIEDLHKLRARSSRGEMVPLGSLANVKEVNGPLMLTRYNMYSAAAVMGGAKPGFSSGEAIEHMSKAARATLAPTLAIEWSDMSFLELLAGDTAMKIFGFAILMVFLVLAAQYESWSLPLAVILVAPMSLLSATIGVRMAHMDINIFTRIGFVVLVGLASKNAILIVEFAKQAREHGETRMQATLEACRLRLRPIIMTSLAFILGVVPLTLAEGAGAEMRKMLGIAVFSGMLGVTLFGLLLTPVFFFTIDWLGGTPVFASRMAHGIGRFSLGILRLKPLGLFPARRKPAPPKKVIRVEPMPAEQEEATDVF